jgi:hypothetical protein
MDNPSFIDPLGQFIDIGGNLYPDFTNFMQYPYLAALNAQPGQFPLPGPDQYLGNQQEQVQEGEVTLPAPPAADKTPEPPVSTFSHKQRTPDVVLAAAQMWDSDAHQPLDPDDVAALPDVPAAGATLEELRTAKTT